MKWLSVACWAGLGVCALTACVREVDSFNPQVVVTSPASGTVTPNAKIEIKGQVIDDAGVQKLVLNGKTDLMASDGPLAAQRGKKIVRFAIPLTVSGDSFELRALDINGREGRRSLTVRRDSQKPKLEIDSLVGEENSVTITGRATDDIKVTKVLVNGSALGISPGSSVAFYASVPRRRYLTITVIDGVGNQDQTVVRAPAAPLPPEPSLSEGSNQDSGTGTQRRRRRGSTTQTTQQTTEQPANTR